MIRITDQYFWNVVFGLFFLILVVMGAIILDTETRIPFAQLTMTDFALISLASWRLVRLGMYDHTTKWFREQFYDVKPVGKRLTLVKPTTGPRRTIADLFTCTPCFATWTTAFVAFLYLVTPYTYYFVLFLAIAAVVSFLQNLTNLVDLRVTTLQDDAE